MSAAIESFFPARTTLVDPALRDRKAFGFDAAGADPPDLFGVDQAAFFEDLQVLNDSGQGDVQRLCQRRDGDGAFAEFLYDGAASGIAEGVEDAVDRGLLGVHAPCLSFSVAT